MPATTTSSSSTTTSFSRCRCRTTRTRRRGAGGRALTSPPLPPPHHRTSSSLSASSSSWRDHQHKPPLTPIPSPLASPMLSPSSWSGRLWSVRVTFLLATPPRIKMEDDTSPSSTTRRPPRHVPATSRPPPSAQGLWVLWQAMCCVCLFLGPWQWTIVGAFVLPSTSHINLERRRTYTTTTAATSHKHVLLKAAAASGPGYIHNPDKRSASSSSKRRGNGGRSPAPPPPPPSHAAAAATTTSSGTSASSLVVSGGKKEEWHRTFEHLQGLTVRQLSDYDAAFSVCRAAQRPFECLSLLRYMSRDELPRKPQWYEATARLAAEMENWVTALDTYILFERKEELNPSCPATRNLLELALQAAERLGKGNRAVRIYEKATQILTPPIASKPAAVLVLRACFRAAAFDLALPFARLLLAETKPKPRSSSPLPPGQGTSDGGREEASFKLDLPTLNMALSTLSKSNCVKEAVAALQRTTTSWNLTPDVYTYGAVIEGLAAPEGGNLNEALALLRHMITTENLRPNVVICNMLLQACCRAGRLQEAWELFQAIPPSERDVHRAQPLWSLATREGNVAVIEGLLEELARVQEQQQQQHQRRGGGGRGTATAAVPATLSLSCYHASLCNLARLGLFDLAERLAALVKPLDGPTPPTAMTFYALVAACEKAGEHERLLGWFQEMLRAKVEPDALRYGMALKSCELLGKWQAGLALMLSMRDRGMVMDPLLWKRLFLLLGREARGGEAVELLGDMEERGLKLEPICYEATVTALARMGDKVQAVKQLVACEESRGVPMGRGAYTSAIAACRESKDAELAIKLYRRMKARSNEAPSTVTRAALLDVLVAAGGHAYLKAAGEVALEQEASGEVVPTHMLGNMALASVARHHEPHDQRDFKKALSYFRPLWVARPDPAMPLPWTLCNAALRACARLGEQELAFEVLRTMRAAKVPVDVVMYGCVLTACAVAGEWREAFLLLKEMERTSRAAELAGLDAQDVVRPNLVCYTSVIAALQQGQEWQKALHLLVHMLSSGPAPDVQVFNAVLSACANAGETHMALKVFQAMQAQGVAADDVTYATAIVACWRGNEWRQAVEILQRMKLDGFPPNMITVTLVIDALDKSRKFDLAVHVFETSVVGYIRSEDYAMESAGPGMLVDLHGYSQPVARAAVRAGLKRLSQMYVQMGKREDLIKDFVFITGVGRNSEMPFEPVLRPAMQRMLTEDFDPPLPCEFVEHNAGRLVVRAHDLIQWLNAQSCKKALSPAEKQSGTLKLRSPEQLGSSFQLFKDRKKEIEVFVAEARVVTDAAVREHEELAAVPAKED